MRIVAELLRITKPSGEIRIGDPAYPLGEDGRPAVDLPNGFNPLNPRPAAEWLALMRYLDEEGCKIYTIDGGGSRKQRDALTGYGFGMVPVYDSLMVRKDEELPRVVLPQAEKSFDDPKLFKINPRESTVSRLVITAVEGKVTYRE